MGCKIKFVDGEELEINRADSSDEEKSFLLIKDKDEELLYELGNTSVKYIKWD